MSLKKSQFHTAMYDFDFCSLIRWLIFENYLIIGWYFLSLWFKTLEFWKCSIKLDNPCRRAYVKLHIYILLYNYFFTTKFTPFLIMKLLIKFLQELSIKKINKPIPDVTVILKSSKNYLNITWKIKKIISLWMFPINLIRQKLYSIFIRYIFNHKCSPWIIFYIIWINIKIIRIYIFIFIIIIVHSILISIKICWIMIRSRCYRLILLINRTWIILPHIFISLLILLCTFRFYLLDLFPIKSNTIHLYFL